MFSFIDLPGLVSTLIGSAVLTGAGAAGRRLLSRRARAAEGVETTAPLEAPRMLRRYTLLRATGPDGIPAQYATTRPTGSVIVQRVNGHPQRFELTDVPLADGTFVAEPLDYL
ncbi:hypothetical protein ACIREE_41095 [Streptomyces sp. NPDC102467]|uniref:hypothetical protein n=1 Tax=Streptomyces sp. NPDC102467 TaxID=3366179 RepID=UPI0037FA01BB